MKHRSVVANFIFKWADHEHSRQNVALFKRSTHPNIRSYQGKYAPISGSIENDDINTLAAAEREIHEETRLTAHIDIVLEFTGKPFSFQDDQAQRSWTVYPYGWILEANESKIQIDWEHSGWEWFKPEDVLNGVVDDECVPRIKESLRRVYFGPNGMFSSSSGLVDRDNRAGRAFFEVFERLKTDFESGARQLATEALKGLLAVCTHLSQYSEEIKLAEKWHALRVAAYHLIYSARPNMNAAISAAIVSSLSHIANDLQDRELDLQEACRRLERGVEERAAASTKIAVAFNDFIDRLYPISASRQSDSSEQERPQGKMPRTMNIITLSNSSTILAALKHLLSSVDSGGVVLNLTILESCPPCEGTNFAASLVSFLETLNPSESPANKRHLNIRIIPDSHVHQAILRTSKPGGETPSKNPSTIILFGADRLTPAGHVFNKSGSAMLAILSHVLPGRESRRTIVLSEEDKIAVPNSRSLSAYKDIISVGSGQKLSEQDTKKLAELSQQEIDTEGHESHSTAEVYAAWPKGAADILVPYLDAEKRDEDQKISTDVHVEVDNFYFEMVPSQYIDTYVGENGEISRDDILRKSVARAEAEEKLFADLYE